MIAPVPPDLGLYTTTGEIVVRGEEGRTTVDLIPYGEGGGDPPLTSSDGYHAQNSNSLLALVPPDLAISSNSGNGSQCVSGLVGDLGLTTGQFGSATVHARFEGGNIIDVAAGNGDITVTMRPEQGATLDSATTTGTLTIDVPFEGTLMEQYASGALGRGPSAGTITLSTFTGAIVIEPR